MYHTVSCKVEMKMYIAFTKHISFNFLPEVEPIKASKEQREIAVYHAKTKYFRIALRNTKIVKEIGGPLTIGN